MNIISRINSVLPEALKLKLIRIYKKMPFCLPQIIFHPTLACNYRCSYCLHQKYLPKDASVRNIIEPQEWGKLLNKFPRSLITISGGEPLSYNGIYELLELISKKHILSQMVTNISVNPDILLKLNKLGMRVMTSFHKEMSSFEDYFQRVKYLKDRGCNIVVNYVGTPDNLKDYAKYKKIFKDELGVMMRLDAQEDIVIKELDKKYLEDIKVHGENYITNRHKTDNHEPKRCLGGSKYFIVMPNADVYRCYEGFWYTVSPAYNGVASPKDKDSFYLGNLRQDSFSMEKVRHICNSPCKSSCDIELGDVLIIKTERK
jgi:MoaA/NifB/PqqE/SkfB family radical SAM enzyme